MDKNRWDWFDARLRELGFNKNSLAAAIGGPNQRIYELFSGKSKTLPPKYCPKAIQLLKLDWKTFLEFNSGLTNATPKFCENTPTEKELLMKCLLAVNAAAENFKGSHTFTQEDKIGMAFLIYDKVHSLSEGERESNIVNLADVLAQAKAS